MGLAVAAQLIASNLPLVVEDVGAAGKPPGGVSYVLLAIVVLAPGLGAVQALLVKARDPADFALSAQELDHERHREFDPMNPTRYATAAAASPLIGLTGRRKSAAIMTAPRGFSDAPIDVYFAEFATSVQGAGALAVHLPLDGDARALVARLDGLVLVGGDDVDPRRYGQAPGPFTTVVDPACDQFETDLVTAALERDIPILGVCRGQQILNVVLGGTLQQHLELGEGESHGSYAYPRAHRVHDVEFTEGSTHAAVYGTRTRVNSFHHQAVDRPGDGVTVVGRAPDGTAEAIEIAGTSAIGVQWHPETFGNDPIFTWLARTASAKAGLTRNDNAQEVAR